MEIILSNISQLLLPAGLRLVKVNRDKTIFLWFVILSCLFAFFDIQLWQAGISHYWLYHLNSTIELLFLSYILLSFIDFTPEWRMSIIFISFILYILCAVFGSDIRGVDLNETFFESVVLCIFATIALMEGQKGWKFFLTVGVLIYCGINLVAYPAHHSIANIIMNIFFFIAIIK